MANNLTFTVGILLLVLGYYVGVVGIDMGDKPEYEVEKSPQGSVIYEVTYVHTYPWLGILMGIYGVVFTVVGLLQKNEKAAEIAASIKERVRKS